MSDYIKDVVGRVVLPNCHHTAPLPQQTPTDNIFLDALREKLPRWQPIGTCPRDIPVLVTNGTWMVVMKRSDFDYSLEFDFEWEDLTHWMPLPEVPR